MLFETVVRDLSDEHGSLADLLGSDGPEVCDLATPSPGWLVRHQVAHLEFFDRMAVLALTDPDAFDGERELAERDVRAYGDRSLRRATSPCDELMAAWRASSTELVLTLQQVSPDLRAPWYGPSMGAASMATARLMECWAHGEDVAEALGVQRPSSSRLRHIAHIAVAARIYSYVNRGLPTPDDEVFVELEAPDGETWRWGDVSSPNRVAGDALEFCRVLTRRVHVDDTSLRSTGSATDWLRIGQAFAGDPGPDPRKLND